MARSVYDNHRTDVGKSDGVDWSVKLTQKGKGRERKKKRKKKKNDGVGPRKTKAVKANNGQRWLRMWGPRYRDSAVLLRNDR